MNNDEDMTDAGEEQQDHQEQQERQRQQHQRRQQHQHGQQQNQHHVQQPISPHQQHQQQQHQHQQRRGTEVPAFFANNGLIMRNADGHLPTNEAALPTEKSFTIQVGPEQFRLSGASINSDAPSYFSRFFEAELAKQQEDNANESVRTLYVDRDPETFRDIALHLQGYHVQARDSTHYVRLFADAQFYVLPRLIKHLYESDVFIRIGEDEFCVPRDLFQLEPGNEPNYFTLGFSLLFSTPGNPFPGLEVSGLLRPPAIKAASVSGRSGRIFSDILDLLRGYEVHIRDEAHRAALLRDCRYYHLRGLEQKIIAHRLGWNETRKTSEITLRLEDLRQSGIVVDEFPEIPPASVKKGEREGGGSGNSRLMVVRYARPFIDNAESAHELILETGSDSATLRQANNNSGSFTVEFHNETRQRIMSLFKVVASKYAALLAARYPVGDVDTAVLGTLGGAGPGPVLPEAHIINEDGMANARIEPDAVVMVDGHESWLLQPSPSIEEDRVLPEDDSILPDDDDINDDGDDNIDEDNKPLPSTSTSTSTSTPMGPTPANVAAAAAAATRKRRRLNNGSRSTVAVAGGHDTDPRSRTMGVAATGNTWYPQEPFTGSWTVMKAQWRVRLESWPRSGVDKSVAIHLYAVNLDVVRGEKGRNRDKGFL